jgi:uncharacterized protein YbjT (DUF2867 family)
MNILLTGATGYVGRRLKMRLLQEKGLNLRILLKDIRRIDAALPDSVEVIEGDFFDREVLRKAVKGMDAVYYPIRIFGALLDFTDAEKTYARTFRDICIEEGVGKIIYVSFPKAGNVPNKILDNILAVGETLSAYPEKIQCIWVRTGALIGAGSVVFEILKSIVEKVPLIFLPPWMRKNIYVIGVDDLLGYLVLAMELPPGESHVIHIYGQKTTFQEMLREAARLSGLKRVFLPVPFFARGVSAFFMMLITPFSYRLSHTLVRTFQSGEIAPNEVTSLEAKRYFPSMAPLSFCQALEGAMEETKSKEVTSRWVDSMENINFSAPEDIAKSVYQDMRELSFGELPPGKIFRAITSIGGESGWFTFDILWRLRGVLDKLLGGYGTSMGRRTGADLRVGDMLDVWKVVDIEADRMLLLEAQMKVAGKAWLEFKISGSTLVQTAYYLPRGIVGKLYWYAVLPFHYLVFNDLIRNIIKKAGEI